MQVSSVERDPLPAAECRRRWLRLRQDSLLSGGRRFREPLRRGSSRESAGCLRRRIFDQPRGMRTSKAEGAAIARTADGLTNRHRGLAANARCVVVSITRCIGMRSQAVRGRDGTDTRNGHRVIRWSASANMRSSVSASTICWLTASNATSTRSKWAGSPSGSSSSAWRTRFGKAFGCRSQHATQSRVGFRRRGEVRQARLESRRTFHPSRCSASHAHASVVRGLPSPRPIVGAPGQPLAGYAPTSVPIATMMRKRMRSIHAGAGLTRWLG